LKLLVTKAFVAWRLWTPLQRQHGRTEVISALHRNCRERAVSGRSYEITVQEFIKEIREGAFR
jgi:hypothetical protein